MNRVELLRRKEQLEKDIAKYSNMQLAKKVQLNSAYGALGNQYFRFYDIRQALAITKSGQLSIKWIEARINEYLNKLLNTDSEDYVIASGQMKSVREFIELSAIELGWNKKNGEQGIIWENSGLDEVGKRSDTGEVVVKIDPRYFRPTEVEQLLGDASKARTKLDWKISITLKELIAEMIKEDLNEAKKEFLLKNEGFSVYISKE